MMKKKTMKTKHKKSKNDLWLKALLDIFQERYRCSPAQRPKLIKYATIIKLGMEYTYDEIGEVFGGLSRQRAEQLHRQAIGHLLAFINQK